MIILVPQQTFGAVNYGGTRFMYEHMPSVCGTCEALANGRAHVRLPDCLREQNADRLVSLDGYNAGRENGGGYAVKN